jgi:uncharacterized membrane-anchored protein
VEGLSVVAVSYYAVGLLSYILKAGAAYLHLSYERAVALSVIPVVVIVSIFLRRKVRQIVETKL